MASLVAARLERERKILRHHGSEDASTASTPSDVSSTEGQRLD